MDIFDYYGILGVNTASPDEQIKDAHRRLSREHHPDKGGDPNKFFDVQAAYQAIKTSTDRRALRGRMSGLGDLCRACDGRGYKIKTISFTASQKTSCEDCKGCGFIKRR